MTPGLLDGPALAAALHLHPGTIRNWAHQGRLTPHGTDQHHRTLYNLEEALAVSTRANPRGWPRITDLVGGEKL